MIVIPIALCLIFLYYQYICRIEIARKPKNYPDEINRQKKDLTKRTLVCFGDSNTHGNVSFDWVKRLRKIRKDLNIFNAGINADLSFTLLHRMDDVIKCEPDFICILIGTNDANARLSPENLNRYRDRGKITENDNPSLESYLSNCQEILKKLQKETKAEIALITLPLLSEDLSFEGNTISSLYSQEIVQLSQTYGTSLLDFRNLQIDLLPKDRSKIKWAYKRFRFMMNASLFIHYILLLPWNTVSKLFGNFSTTDNIHLNEHSGTLLLNLVNNWLPKNTA